jgi:hypothetical protein
MAEREPEQVLDIWDPAADVSYNLRLPFYRAIRPRKCPIYATLRPSSYVRLSFSISLSHSPLIICSAVFLSVNVFSGTHAPFVPVTILFLLSFTSFILYYDRRGTTIAPASPLLCVFHAPGRSSLTKSTSNKANRDLFLSGLRLQRLEPYLSPRTLEIRSDTARGSFLPEGPQRPVTVGECNIYVYIRGGPQQTWMANGRPFGSTSQARLGIPDGVRAKIRTQNEWKGDDILLSLRIFSSRLGFHPRVRTHTFSRRAHMHTHARTHAHIRTL